MKRQVYSLQYRHVCQLVDTACVGVSEFVVYRVGIQLSFHQSCNIGSTIALVSLNSVGLEGDMPELGGGAVWCEAVGGTTACAVIQRFIGIADSRVRMCGLSDITLVDMGVNSSWGGVLPACDSTPPGVSIARVRACVSRYFFSMNVEWSASVKEVSQNDFWTEVRRPCTIGEHLSCITVRLGCWRLSGDVLYKQTDTCPRSIYQV